jgi:hypothetical protein
MRKPFILRTAAIYDDYALMEGLGVAKLTLENARRSGMLRSTRKGHQMLYLGKWVKDWFEGGSRPGKPASTDNSSPAAPDQA